MNFTIFKPNWKTILGYIGGVILLLYFWVSLINISNIEKWQELHMPMILTVVTCTFIIFVDNKTLPFGANSMVYLYMVLSLLGLLILLPWFPDIAKIRSELTMSFLYSKELIQAIILSCMGIITFVMATSFFSHKYRVSEKIQPVIGKGLKDLDESDSEKYKGFTVLGLYLAAFCAFYFMYLIVKDPGMLFSEYVDRTKITNNNSLYSYATVVMALSIIIIFTKGSRKDIKVGSIIFGISALINFLLGNRGEVYYPILACIAVYTKRNGTFKLKTLIIGVSISLLLISVIRTIRSIGTFSGGILDFLKTISPIDAIAESIGEMGFQIGPFTYMLKYISFSNDFQNGSTIIYSFQNFLYKYIPFIPNPDPTSPAAVKSIMPTDYYAFASLAEGYYNFGIIGMLLFSIVLAWYLVNSNKYLQGPYGVLFSNMFLVEIILWVRNSSATLPVYLAWSVLLLILAWLFQSLYETKNRKNNNYVDNFDRGSR